MIKSASSKISTLALTLLITGAIDSIRNLPATALFGTQLIFFFIVGAIFFLIPVALIAAELSAAWVDEEGGIFHWLDLAYGEKVAFFGIWLQWINTLVWYPTMLSFIAGTAAYLISPSLAQNKLYLIGVINVTFWGVTLVNLKGLKASAKFASFCAVAGMIIPMAIITGLGIVWLIGGNPIQLEFTAGNMLPQFTHSESWSSLTAIMTSFLGMELAAVHVKQVHNPQKNFPKAMFASVAIILLTMGFGSLAIAFVVPVHQIHLVDGVMQTFQYFFNQYHAEILLPIITILLLIGSAGALVNWIISPAKGLLLASKHGFLPAYLTKTNAYQVPQRILLLQAITVTLLCGAFYFIPSINAIYWLFTDLSTELYIVMYLLMFIAAIKLRQKYPNKPRPFKVPGGNAGYYLTCMLGIIGCIITLIVGFFPPADSLNMAASTYRVIFSLGIVAMALPSLFFYLYKSLSQKPRA